MALTSEFCLEPLPEGKVCFVHIYWSEKTGCIVEQHIVDEYVSTWTKIKRRIKSGLEKYKITRKDIL